MKETCIKKYTPSNVETMVSDMALFYWEEESREFKEKEGVYYVTFARETDNIAHYEEVKELEAEWNNLVKAVPLWPLWLFLIPVFVLVSVYLGGAIVSPDVFKTNLMYIAFFVPSGVLLLGGVLYTVFRTRGITKRIDEAPARREEIISKLKELSVTPEQDISS
ncbi:MAG: hypothetical protein LUB56_00055 [Coprobacillus sp.]|nr:hypothetical protein [Coprobacillus sp.]